MLAACVVLTVGATGCGNSQINGQPDANTGPDASPEALAARMAFDNEVLPLLQANCSCHGSNAAGVGFVEPNPAENPDYDAYQTLLGWNEGELLDLPNPGNSLLLTKGQHTGPPWSPEDFEVVRNWIELEATAIGVEPPTTITTAIMTPMQGLNTIDLTPIELPGSTVTFLFESIDTGAYLSEIRLNAGTGGARIKHPLFVPYIDGEAQPDPIDRFSFVELSVEEGESAYIGGGTFVMTNFPPVESELQLIFEEAERLDGMMGGVVLQTCLDVPGFIANAKPALDFCADNCHAGGDQMATNATNMVLLNSPDPMHQEEACGQILSRVYLQDPVNSGILLAPKVDSNTFHPYKFGDILMVPPYTTATHPFATYQDFVDAILLWANSEAALQQSP